MARVDETYGNIAPDGPIPTIAQGQVAIPLTDVGSLQYLQTFDIRNGDVSTAKSLLVRATIPEVWHWRPIKNLPNDQAIANTGAYIQLALAQLLAARPADMSEAQARKAAILVGTARAVMTELYRLTFEDINVGERDVPWLQAVMTTDDPPRMVIVPTAEATGETLNRLQTSLNLTPEENAAVASAHMSAVGLLPLQGYSLVMTNHHYLSNADSQSFKAYQVVERTVWGAQDVSAWWVADAKHLTNALWHKAAHPVSLTLKRKLAYDPAVKKKLIDAGAGPAAARLPATDSEVRAGQAYSQLLTTVKPLLEGFGGGIDFARLTQAIDMVSVFPADDPSTVFNPEIPEGYPVAVNSRLKALQYLSVVMKSCEGAVGWCYGFYAALSDANAMAGTTRGADTLRTSYSLKKLMTQSHATYIAGQLAYSDYTAAKAVSRQRGEFDAPLFKV